MGAQVAANIAEYGQSQYGQKVDKIVALISSTKNQLDKGDAKSVIALHTDYKGLFPLGVGGDVGTVDLYFKDEVLETYKYPLDHQDSIAAFFEYIRYGNGKTYQEFFASKVNNKQVDPIILDLNNDGIELLSLKDSPVTFDLDNDGHPEPTGWIAPEDAFLAQDRNQDGKINNITELFSEYYSPEAETGLEAIATLDSNHDNIINPQDAQYGTLSLWQDRNLNGETDPFELTPLSETDITAIHLYSTYVLQNQEGNLLLSTTQYTRTDGTPGEAAEAALLIHNTDSLTGISPTLDTPELISPQPDIFNDNTLLTYDI